MPEPPRTTAEERSSRLAGPLFRDRVHHSGRDPAGLLFGQAADYWLHTQWLYLVGLLFGAVVGFWQMIRMAMGAYKEMNEPEHLDQPPEPLPAESLDLTHGSTVTLIYERIIPRVLRNMLVASVLLLGPAFWFYRWAGSARVCLWGSRFLRKFPLADARRRGLGRPHRQPEQSGKRGAGSSCVSWCATGWSESLPMLYSKVLPWRFAAFCGACACR